MISFPARSPPLSLSLSLSLSLLAHAHAFTLAPTRVQFQKSTLKRVDFSLISQAVKILKLKRKQNIFKKKKALVLFPPE